MNQSSSTLDQQLFNAMHETCKQCNGRGYMGGSRAPWPHVGCDKCHGLGVREMRTVTADTKDRRRLNEV